MNGVGGFYVERAIDEDLWGAARKWMGSSSQAHWIFLISLPGLGNTALLKHFEQRAAKDEFGLSEARIIYIEAPSSPADQPPPSELAPLAQTVFDRHLVVTKTWRIRLNTWLHDRDSRRLFVNTLLIFFLFLIVGILYEMTSSGIHLLSQSWWRQVLADLETEHFRKIAIDAIVALLLAVAVELARDMLKAKTESEHSASDERKIREFNSFRNGGHGFIRGLEEQCRGARALVLLLDNAHSLPRGEKQLLYDLVQPSAEGSALQRFTSRHRVLIVSLDLEDNVWALPKPTKAHFQQLAVTPFTQVELQDILRHTQWPASDEDAEWLLEQAQQNIKALFLPQQDELRSKVEAEYVQAREDGIRGVFGRCELMAYWAVRQTKSITKLKLLDWLRDLQSEHLRMFDVRSPEQPQELVKQFANCCLVRTEGETLHFDAAACKALRKWMRENPQEKEVLAQAHYYWLTALTKSLLDASCPNAWDWTIWIHSS